MADAVVGGGASKLPQSFWEKLSFSVPVIIVTFLLSVGVAVVILLIVDGNTRDELKKLSDVVEQKTKKLGDDLAVTQKAMLVATDNIDKLQKKTSELDEVSKKQEAELNKTNLAVTEFRIKFNEQDKSITDIRGTTIKHESDLADHSKKIKYIEDKIAKLDEIANDVASLKVDTAGLKKEYEVLKGDLTAVKTKADVTEKDLIDLGDRARKFQMRVLLARAHEAAEAARQTDLKGLLIRLNDVEGGN